MIDAVKLFGGLNLVVRKGRVRLMRKMGGKALLMLFDEKDCLIKVTISRQIARRLSAAGIRLYKAFDSHGHKVKYVGFVRIALLPKVLGLLHPIRKRELSLAHQARLSVRCERWNALRKKRVVVKQLVVGDVL